MGWLRVRVVVALLAGALAVGACSREPSSPEDFGLLPPTSPGETTASSTTTTRPTTTTSSTTTTTTTVVTGSTLPNGKPILEIPTEWDSDLEEVIGRYLLYWEALAIAMGPPSADPNYGPLIELTEPGIFEDLEAQIEEKREAGQILLEAQTATEHLPRLPSPSVLVKTEGNEVVLQDCFIDGRTVQSLDGEIINDDVVVKLMNVKMEVLDGEWRVSAVREASPDSDGYEECKEYGSQVT